MKYAAKITFSPLTAVQSIPQWGVTKMIVNFNCRKDLQVVQWFTIVVTKMSPAITKQNFEKRAKIYHVSNMTHSSNQNA